MTPTIRAVVSAAALLLAVAAVGVPSSTLAAPKATPAPSPAALPTCNGSRCTAYGPGSQCTLVKAKQSVASNCKAFAAVNGTCEAIAAACVEKECDGTSFVSGSDGQMYCNWCTLTAASCESGFKLYKVAMQTPPATSVPDKSNPSTDPPATTPGGVVKLFPGPDGCTPLQAGDPKRQDFPPYSDFACPEDYTLCDDDADCGRAPGGKRMVCLKTPDCSSSRCTSMAVSDDRTVCTGTGRCTRDCRRDQGLCTPVFC